VAMAGRGPSCGVGCGAPAKAQSAPSKSVESLKLLECSAANATVPFPLLTKVASRLAAKSPRLALARRSQW
jgi:hypothetical protein